MGESQMRIRWIEFTPRPIMPWGGDGFVLDVDCKWFTSTAWVDEDGRFS